MLREFKRMVRKLRGKSKYAFYSGNRNISTPITQLNTTENSVISWSNVGINSEPNKIIDERIKKKPIEVYKEIISEIPKIDLSNLNKQIALVKKRKDMLGELGLNPGDESEALLYLNARKKLNKHITKFNWVTTNEELISKLCSTYKLRLVAFESYYKNIPMEAIDELEKFIDAWELVRTEKPILKLIIDEGGKETKKDPILLAQSPFGRWYYILGAWDKEVEIVDDLIYKGK